LFIYHSSYRYMAIAILINSETLTKITDFTEPCWRQNIILLSNIFWCHYIASGPSLGDLYLRLAQQFFSFTQQLNNTSTLVGLYYIHIPSPLYSWQNILALLDKHLLCALYNNTYACIHVNLCLGTEPTQCQNYMNWNNNLPERQDCTLLSFLGPGWGGGWIFSCAKDHSIVRGGTQVRACVGRVIL